MESLAPLPGSGEAMTEQPPIAYPVALRALASCLASTARLLWRRQVHLPRARVGARLSFADGTSARVYRETAADRGSTLDPCVLIVEFRLRAVRGPGPVTSAGHRIRLHDLLAKPGVHILLDRDAPSLDTLPLGRLIHVHRITSMPGQGLTAVRPDGHIGFRCDVADIGQLTAWLTRMRAGATGQ